MPLAAFRNALAAVGGGGYKISQGGGGGEGGSGGGGFTATLVRTIQDPNYYGTPGGDQFGYDVATNGTYTIVGCYAEDSAAYLTQGYAYLINNSTGSVVHTVTSPNPQASGSFGAAVAISTNYFAVAAHGETTGGYTNSGRVYVFNISTGSLVYTFNNPNPTGTTSADYFGRFRIDMTDTHLIAGAYFEDTGGSANGAAYVFSLTSGSLLYTKASPVISPTNQRYGWNTAITDNYFIVSSQGYNTYNGRVYVYNISDGSLAYTLDNPNKYPGSTTNDIFGYYISASGSLDMLAVSAYNEDTDNVGNNAGVVYVFQLSTGTQLYNIDDPNAVSTPDNDYFGKPTFGSDFLAISAYNEKYDNSGTLLSVSGVVYIFDVATGSLQHTILNPNNEGTQQSDVFGFGINARGNTLVVGAHGELVGGYATAGVVYIFE